MSLSGGVPVQDGSLRSDPCALLLCILAPTNKSNAKTCTHPAKSTQNHLDGLSGLLAAIAAEGFRRHATEMCLGLEGTTPGKERLAAAGYVPFARKNPPRFRLMFSPRLISTESKEVAEARAESYAVLKCAAAGLVWPHPSIACNGDLPAQQTELMLRTFVDGYASL